MEKVKNVSKSIAGVIGLPFRFVSWLVYIGDLQKETFYYGE